MKRNDIKKIDNLLKINIILRSFHLFNMLLESMHQKNGKAGYKVIVFFRIYLSAANWNLTNYPKNDRLFFNKRYRKNG